MDRVWYGEHHGLVWDLQTIYALHKVLLKSVEQIQTIELSKSTTALLPKTMQY